MKTHRVSRLVCSIAALAALVLASVFLASCDTASPLAPEGSTLSLSASPTRIAADGSSTITAVALKPTGQPVNPGTIVRFSTTVGTIASSVPTDESGQAVATLQGTGEFGTATVSASLGGGDPITIEVVIGISAKTITLQTNPSAVSDRGDASGNLQPIELLATIRDDRSQPVEGAMVDFSTEAGSLDSAGRSVTTDAAGLATDTLVLTREDARSVQDNAFMVKATVATVGAGGGGGGSGSGEGGGTGGTGGGGVVSATAMIRIQRTTASTIAVTTSSAAIPETGGDLSIVAIVRDGQGQPLEGALVNFGTDIGSLSSQGSLVETNALGEARDTLSASEGDLGVNPDDDFLVRGSVGGPSGDLITDEATITIQRLPRPDFSFSRSGLTVFFMDTSTGRPTSWRWDFGDGSFDTNQNPSHTFMPSATAYRVTLTATNALGSRSTTQPVLVSGSNP